MNTNNPETISSTELNEFNEFNELNDVELEKDLGKTALEAILLPPPEGYKTAGDIVTDLEGKVSDATIARIARKLGIEGEIYRKNGQKATFYSPVEKEKIINDPDIQELLSLDEAPEGYKTAGDIAKENLEGKISDIPITNIAKKLGIEGEIYRKRDGKKATFYSPAEIQKIINDGNIQELLSLDEAPEGYKTAVKIADELTEELDRKRKIDSKTIQNIAQRLKITGQKFKGRNGHSTTFYSPEEQAAIKNELALEDPPEGWFTIRGLAEELNISKTTIKKYIDQAPLIEGKEYKDKVGRPTLHYPLAEVKKRIEHLISAESAPEDWFPIKGLARQLELSPSTIQRAINQDPPIKGKDYKLDDGQLVTHFSLSEVKKRVEHLASAESAPEGWLTRGGLMYELDLSDNTIQRAINQDPPIEGKEYKDTNSHLTLHYPLAEIKKRVEHLISAESAPEGWLTINGLAKKYELDGKVIRRTRYRASVKGKEYKSAEGHIRTFYSPEEQAQILETVESTASGTSFPENAVAFYLRRVGLNIQQNFKPGWLKGPLGGQMEIDIFIKSDNPPPLGVGIEYDGHYFHQDPEYDARKNTLAREQDIKIIHIREQGCPELPENVPYINRQNNNSDRALEVCVEQCFIMLGISLPSKGINIKRDTEDIYNLMRSRGIEFDDEITEEYIQEGEVIPAAA